MSDIKVGDRVKFRLRRKWLIGYKTETFFGEVMDFDNIEETRVAVVIVFNCDGEIVPVPLSDLRVVSATEVLQAIAAQPLDDQAREEVVASLRLPPSPLEIITTDYELQREVGDYGGREG